MLKFLIFVGFFFFLIYYILILPFKPRKTVDDKRTYRKRPINGNVDIEFDPKEKRERRKSNFNDGDYVDYEEVDWSGISPFLSIKIIDIFTHAIT